MKRFLILIVIALMTMSMIACSSSNSNPETSAPPKVAVSSMPSVTPTPTDTSKASGTPAPTVSSEASSTPAPTDTSKASGTPSPTNSPKVSGTPASTNSSKASGTPTPEPAIQPDDKSTPAPQAEAVSPKGKKVLFVGRDASSTPAEDVFVANRLKALGFSVTTMVDREFTADETKGYDLIYISQTTNSKVLKGGTLKDVAIPTVYVKNHGMFYLGLSSIEEGAIVKNIKSISIVDSKHKVADGLSGSVDVYKETNDKISIGYGLPGKEAKVIATIPGDKTKAAIYYYDKGAKADNGYAAKARLSYFYLSNGMQENTTDAGWKLLDNLVLWTLQNG